MRFFFVRANSFATPSVQQNESRMNSLLRFCFIFFPLFSLTLQADYQTGLDAYTIGDYQTAMKEWTAVAEGPATAVNPLVYVETHYAIAMLYWQGQGVPRDFYQAHEWLLKAANLNHAGAQAKLGYLYTDGISVHQDFDQAFEWYSKAAKQGDIDGQYNLGIFYLNGWGTEQDTTMAKMYLAAASAQGDEAAEEALRELMSDSSVHHDESVRANSFATQLDQQNESRMNSLLRDDVPQIDVIQNEAWILTQPPNHYTIQVIGLSSPEKLKALINDHNNLAPFAIYTVQRSSNPIHVLLQGNYPDVDAARRARDNFPPGINRPDEVWIRQYGKIQELIAKEGAGDG